MDQLVNQPRGKKRAATASSWQQCPYLDRSMHDANTTSHACNYTTTPKCGPLLLTTFNPKVKLHTIKFLFKLESAESATALSM